jgi:hypothetical protein
VIFGRFSIFGLPMVVICAPYFPFIYSIAGWLIDLEINDLSIPYLHHGVHAARQHGIVTVDDVVERDCISINFQIADFKLVIVIDIALNERLKRIFALDVTMPSALNIIRNEGHCCFKISFVHRLIEALYDLIGTGGLRCR